MRQLPFVFYSRSITFRGKSTQQFLDNEYFWEHLGRINQHMVQNDLSFEWKKLMIDHLVSLVGWPVKLSWWGRLIAKIP